MDTYTRLLSYILENGSNKEDRTGVGTRSIFGYQIAFNLSDGFPLLTTKRLPTKAVIHDILWMLSGSTNVKYLNDNGVHIWDPWADETGDVGPVYGRQWRAWPDGQGGVIDQIEWVINEIKTNPDSRRLIVSAWNVADLNKMAVPPCPTLFQFNVTNGFLSCHLYQRSADAFIGLPFNIAGFSLLTEMVAHVTDLKPGHYVHSFGDLHLYKSHIDLAKEQLKRIPFAPPKLILSQEITDIFEFTHENIIVENYNAHPHIKADVAI